MTNVGNSIREEKRVQHWENVYANHPLEKVGWYQPIPETSLDLIKEAKIPKDGAVLDVGGGDSLLVDHLLERGYTDLTVLDISDKAIQRAQRRLGQDAQKVNWIHTDITQFKPTRTYDVWHDRACFHFLTETVDIDSYFQILNRSLKVDATAIIGVFSKNGPDRCSGLDIKKYDKESLKNLMDDNFQLTHTFTVDHITPSRNTQNYIYACFKKQVNKH